MELIKKKPSQLAQEIADVVGDEWLVAEDALGVVGRVRAAVVLARTLKDLSGELVTSGAGNDYVVIPSRTITALADGYRIAFRADRINAGAATLQVPPAAAVALVKRGGTALAAGDIEAGAIYTATYVAAAGEFRLAASVTLAEVQALVDALVGGAPGALDTLNELAAALGDDANFATTVTNALAAKAPLASPTFTGTPAAPTAAGGTNTTQIATTAFVQGAIGSVQTDRIRRDGILAPHENLQVNTTGVATLAVTADALLLFDATGVPKRFEAVNVSGNMATSGAGGLDTGAEASNTWYAIWIVGTAAGAVAALLSTSFSAPTMPGGYTFKGFVGAVRNDGSSNFIPLMQAGTVVQSAGAQLVTGGTATNFAAISVGAAAPPNAAEIDCMISVFTSSGSTFCQCLVTASGSGTTSTYSDRRLAGPADTSGFGQHVFVPIDRALAQFMYRVTGANVQVNIAPKGWRF